MKTYWDCEHSQLFTNMLFYLLQNNNEDNDESDKSVINISMIKQTF